MKFKIMPLLLLLAVAQPLWAAAAEPQPAARPSRGPLPTTVKAVSSHAPFESGDCNLCHGVDMCLGCHEEFAEVLKRPNVHPPARKGCISCHNAHNSTNRKLLLAEPQTLCAKCHDEVTTLASTAKVPHRAVTTGSQCVNCHNPHGSSVAKLLIQQPMDLCLKCHNTDTMKDASGKPLQNTKAWLDQNPVWHEPLRKKDCGACHQPHGSDHFRLLSSDYPQEFYAPYDARSYALCFSCHQEPAFSTPKTTTLTSFRDGETNLHYVHLQQGNRGRTCRACHEVHASTQDHHIREGVPYGSSGWVLKLHYQKTPTGGSCAKTCHQERGYSNKKAP
jgi:predicted CXXCH cytochrome family protein